RVRRHLDPLQISRRPAQLAEGKLPAAAPPDLRRQIRGLEQAAFGEILGVDVADGPLVNDAQPGAQVIAGADPLHLALLNADRLVALALDEELDEIGTRPQRALDHAIHEGLFEQWHLDECSGVFPIHCRAESQFDGFTTGSRTSPTARAASATLPW